MLSSVQEEGIYLHVPEIVTFKGIDAVLEYRHDNGAPSDFVLIQITKNSPKKHAAKGKPDRLMLTRSKRAMDTTYWRSKSKYERILRTLLRMDRRDVMDGTEAVGRTRTRTRTKKEVPEIKGKVGFIYITPTYEKGTIESVPRNNEQEEFDTSLIEWFGDLKLDTKYEGLAYMLV